MFRYSPLQTAPDCHNLMPHIWLWLSNCVPKWEYFICIQVPHNTGSIWGWSFCLSLAGSGVKSHVTLEIDIFMKTTMVFNGKLWQLLKQLFLFILSPTSNLFFWLYQLIFKKAVFAHLFSFSPPTLVLKQCEVAETI